MPLVRLRPTNSRSSRLIRLRTSPRSWPRSDWTYKDAFKPTLRTMRWSSASASNSSRPTYCRDKCCRCFPAVYSDLTGTWIFRRTPGGSTARQDLHSAGPDMVGTKLHSFAVQLEIVSGPGYHEQLRRGKRGTAKLVGPLSVCASFSTLNIPLLSASVSPHRCRPSCPHPHYNSKRFVSPIISDLDGG